jgi:hypothetical protein
MVAATWEGTMNAEPLTSVELEVVRHLFFRGLTWDGYLPDRDCCASLRDRGLAQYEFGFAWLTSEGEAIAVQELDLDREDMAAA